MHPEWEQKIKVRYDKGNVSDVVEWDHLKENETRKERVNDTDNSRANAKMATNNAKEWKRLPNTKHMN